MSAMHGRCARGALSLVVAALLAGTAAGSLATCSAAAELPPRPAGWPSTLQLGVKDGAGTGAATHAKFRTGLRYQYLAGGVNTGRGWATWNPRGTFVSKYVRESVKAGVTPVFSYYNLRHSTPGSRDRDEARGDLRNLRDPATMRALYSDVALALTRAGQARPALVVLHVEPDLWAVRPPSSARSAPAST
jgi:hypothetical protein